MAQLHLPVVSCPVLFFPINSRIGSIQTGTHYTSEIFSPCYSCGALEQTREQAFAALQEHE